MTSDTCTGCKPRQCTRLDTIHSVPAATASPYDCSPVPTFAATSLQATVPTWDTSAAWTLTAAARQSSQRRAASAPMTASLVVPTVACSRSLSSGVLSHTGSASHVHFVSTLHPVFHVYVGSGCPCCAEDAMVVH
jgi:hypothetical protein